MDNNINNKEESPLIKGLREYFDETPQEVLDKELAELERFNGFGPVVDISKEQIGL